MSIIDTRRWDIKITKGKQEINFVNKDVEFLKKMFIGSWDGEFTLDKATRSDKEEGV